MNRVLGVHGIGNYHYFRDHGATPEGAADAISADWRSALELSTPRGSVDEVRVAYYAHHLHRGTPQSTSDPASLEPGAQDLLVDWVESLQLEPQVAQGPRTARARQAADWLTRKFGKAARLFAVAFCREVHTYLSDPDSPRRSGARQAVADAIAEHRPTTVVAHSLGSVVAYEALAANPDLSVNLLVTLGSPLAMPGVVLDRLLPPVNGGRGSRPPGVRRWVNVADVGDLVAIPRTGLAPHFDGVEDDLSVTIGAWDFHTARAYLTHADVGRLLT